MVGDPDGLLVVLDHHHRVAQVTHSHQRLDQAAVVALVKPDRRLVEHVQHAHQARADLAGQPDPLGLSPGQGGRAARQVQVVEAHVEQEAEPGADLLEHLLGDHGVAVVEVHLGQGFGRLRYRHRAQIVDVAAVDGDGQRQRVEPGAAAVRARHLAHVALDVLPGSVAVGLVVAAHQVRDDPLVAGLVHPAPAEAVLVADLHPAPDPLGVQQHVVLARGEFAPGDVARDLVFLAYRLEQARVVPRSALGPGRDRPAGQRGVGVGDNELGVDLEHRAQAVAVGAGAVRRVEREVAGGQLLERLAVGGPGQVLAEDDAPGLFAAGVAGGGAFGDLLPGDDLDLGYARGQPQSRLDRVGEPALDTLAQHQPVHHDGDVVHLVTGQLQAVGTAGQSGGAREVGELDQLAVDDGPGEALPGEIGQQRVVGALAAPHHRRQHLEAGAGLHLQDAVHDLLGGLADESLTGLGIVGHADAGEEKTQVVVDLGDGADGGSGIARRALLVDRNRRRQALDEVDIGLVHLAQELPCVGRQRFHIAALALGVDGVEGQRTLSGARQPGDHDQSVPGKVQVNVLEVVLARPRDHQPLSHAQTLPADPIPVANTRS